MRIIIILCLISVPLFSVAQERIKVIIDADTGNEVDDLYAIVRGLIEPSWDVIGLNATQWQVSHLAVEKTMEDSHSLNQVLASYLKMNEKIKLNRGATARLFDWGNLSHPSAASNFIISEALKSKDGKINVVALGALTNVASAILDNPEVISKIRLYWLGTLYDFEQRLMKTTDFNSVMDIQAVEIILNSDIELHIIPVNTAISMTLNWKETVERFEGKHDLLDFLLKRWFNHMDGGRRERVIWDLALIQAIISPRFAEEIKIRTSRERGDREVWMYKSIDGHKMREDFYKTTLEYMKDLE
ncbi:MAG: nucleoside hydrolase [Catalinimonas sp.]